MTGIYTTGPRGQAAIRAISSATFMIVALAEALARAQPAPTSTPAPAPPLPPAATAATAAATSDPLSDADKKLLQDALSGEVIEVWDERANKPFDRDTELRLTGAELARRGIANLADALQLIPELQIRSVNRGGQLVDIRGARKDSIKVLIDGIPVGDPYRGNFDVSAIPVTDIVEIRISTSPASPIDGTGGDGGVIEVVTRDAIGGRWVGMRMDAGTLSQASASASAREMLSRHFAVRVSATGDLGDRDVALLMPNGQPTSLDEDRRTASGALRLEYRDGTRRWVTDFSGHTGGYLVPASETTSGQLTQIEGARDARIGSAIDDELGGWRLQARGYAGVSDLNTRFYPNALRQSFTTELVSASSVGGGFVANRPISQDLQLIGSTTIDSESGDVTENRMPSTGGTATLASIATGFKYLSGPLRADGAVGGAIPLGLGYSPWPEAKLSVKATTHGFFTGRMVTGYKGRLPTLMERFGVTGSEALGPEKSLFGETGLAVEKNRYVSLDVAGWVRRTNGLIRVAPGTLTLTNLGTLDMYGVDFRVTALPYDPVRIGGSVTWIRDTSATLGDDSIDRLPHWKGDAWLAGDLGPRAGGVLRARYIGWMLDRGMLSTGQNPRLPGYWLAEASSYLWLSHNLMANLRIDNAFDNRYLELASGVFGVGRSVVLSLQGTWE